MAECGGSDAGIEDAFEDLIICEEELGCTPLPKTPDGKGKRKSSTVLTPTSRCSVEPSLKSLQESDTESERPVDEKSSEITKPKPTSAFHKKRRESLVTVLREHFELRIDQELEQEVILEVLALNESQKSQATRAVREAFPESIVVRKPIANKLHTFYKNVARKNAFTCTTSNSSVIRDDNSDISNIRQLINNTSAELRSVTQRIDDHLSAVDIKRDVLKALILKQNELQSKIQDLTNTLEKMYEREVHKMFDYQSQCDVLCSKDKAQLNSEVSRFIEFVNVGVASDLTAVEFNSVFSTLQTNVRKDCPLLFDVLDTLLLQKNSARVASDLREKSACHALAILISLRSQKIQNDFKLMFTSLCISLGAGMQFIRMLNHLGLAVSWQKAIKFFDNRRKNLQDLIRNVTPPEKPVMLMMDNINIYRGNRKHLRLFKYIGPSMWNFTGQALLLPNVEGLEEILCNKDQCLTSQKNVLELRPEDILLDSDERKSSLYSGAVDAYLLELLHDGLNRVPSSGKKLKEMTEVELNSFLAKTDFEKSTAIYNIRQPKEKEILTKTSSAKSEVRILPLSLEDNSTIFGTMSILDRLATNFNLPNEKKGAEYVPFDSVLQSFDLNSARSHFELLVSQKHHESYMTVLENRLRSREKDLDGYTEDGLEEVDDGESAQESQTDTAGSTTLENEKRRFQKEDGPFWEMYNSLFTKLSDVTRANSDEAYLHFVNNTSNTQAIKAEDHLKRSLLHVAVELGNEKFAKCLIDMGIDVNAREGCGITALGQAVLQKNTALCKCLVESGARYDGPLFTSVPSPLQMAQTLQLDAIRCLFEDENAISEEEDDLIRMLDGDFTKKSLSSSCNQTKEHSLDRTTTGFVTPVVGDVGTCKTNGAVMSRSASYKWVGLCPGDLHNKGYLCEAAFKVHGSSGFHYLLAEVLKRKRLSSEVFKRKKFQENNLLHVREGIRDACRAYGIAAVQEFADSNMFPTQTELIDRRSQSSLLLGKFKRWISVSSTSDVAFQHRATAFLTYGPLQKLYDAATSYGDSFAREAVFQMQVPLYAQLGLKNYFTETFRHVVNFLAKWPLITRLILQQNCCVNLHGKDGHGIELDAFVEAEVVQPLKAYVSGHTSVIMCERLMANLDLLKLLRLAYMGKDGFDVHRTSKHSEQSALPDQLKGAWFCLKKGFFESKNREDVECYPLDKKGSAHGKVPRNLRNVLDKGQMKVMDTFASKLYDCFPDLRYNLLSQ